MTDMAPGLGATAGCPECGAQVEVPQGGATTCPKCGAAVSADRRDYAESDVTTDEVLRGYGANGFDVDVAVSGTDGLQCAQCGTSSPAGDFRVEDLQYASDDTSGAGTMAVAAVVCPSCQAAGRVLLDPDDETGGAVLAALTR